MLPILEKCSVGVLPNLHLRPLSRRYSSCFLRKYITMAGDAHVDESQFKGMSKYFNGTTMRGRANVAKATYAAVGLIIFYNMVKPKKSAAKK